MQKRLELEQATQRADWERAARLQYEIRELEQQRVDRRGARSASAARTAARWSKKKSTRTTSPRSSASGPACPVSKLLEGEVEKLLQMEERLRERVVGQDEAIGAVANTVRAARAGLQDPNRPLGSFLFLGPDRRRQDRDCARAGRVPVRRRAGAWSAST